MRIAVLAALALVAAACGGTDDSGSAAPPATTTRRSVPAPSPLTEPRTSEAAPRASDVPTPEPPSAQAISPSAGVERAPIDPDAPVRELAAGFNDAGFDLLRRQPAGDNVVFSPASIGHALLMAAAAGDDPTRQAIEEAFGLPDLAHEAWNTLDQQIADANSDDVTVTTADRIWPRLDVEPSQEWIDLLAAQHGADVVPLDFNNDPAGSRDTINDGSATARSA